MRRNTGTLESYIVMAIGSPRVKRAS